MRPLNAMLALITGIAGWYYLFYSRSAHRLTGLETIFINRQRVFLRRANGVALLILALLLYVGAFGVDERVSPALFASVWLAAILLLVIVIILVLADIRFTMRIGKKPKRANGRLAPGRDETSGDE